MTKIFLYNYFCDSERSDELIVSTIMCFFLSLNTSVVLNMLQYSTSAYFLIEN